MKKLMKRTLSLILAMFVIFGALPELSLSASAAASETATMGGATVTWQDTGTDQLVFGMGAVHQYSAAKNGDNGLTISGTGTNAKKILNSTGGFKVTFTNNLGALGKLFFTYKVTSASKTFNLNGTAITPTLNKAVAMEVSLKAGEEYTIEAATEKGSGSVTMVLSGISLVKDQKVNMAFQPAAGGSFTVAATLKGEAIVPTTQVTEEKSYIFDATAEYTLQAAPQEGKEFIGWKNVTTGKIVSFSQNWVTRFGDDATLTPLFDDEGVGYYEVNDDGNWYNNLNDAITAAKVYVNRGSSAKIALVHSGILPAGEYIIPDKVTLLIPFDDAHTLYTTEPDVVKVYSTPLEYRRLTVPQGATITVESGGSISVSSKLSASGTANGQNGMPTGSGGRIKLEGGNIELENGAALYCYGFISGPGGVLAKKGSTVYECFQLTCWRGGTVGSSMIDNKSGVFPFSQYYVQNIESSLTLEAGAAEYVYAAGNTSAGVHPGCGLLIGESQGLFRIKSGFLTKEYKADTDRLELTLKGDGAIASMQVKISITVDSSKYVAPINSNMTIHVTDGSTLNVNEEVALLPEAELIVDSGASVGINRNVFVYDVAQWDKNYATASTKLSPAPFSVGTAENKTTPANIRKSLTKSATIDLNGSVNVNANGALYTTESGANVISSKGTGKMIFNANAGTEENTYQATQANTSVSYQPISITSAQLKNADGSYTPTAGTGANTTYFYANGKWFVPMAQEVWDGLELPGSEPLEYDGKSHTYDLTGVDKDKADQITVSYVKDGETVEEPKDAGEYTVKFTCGNYTERTATLTIQPKELAVNWKAPENLTYDGQRKEVTAEIAEGGVQEGDKDKVSLNVTGNTGTDAGSYTATATLSGDAAGNYKLAGANDKGEVTHEWTIGKADTPKIIFPETDSVPYAPDGTLNSVPLKGGSTGYGTFAWTAPDTKPMVGNTGYEVTFTPSDDAKKNYVWENQTQTQNVALTVNPKELTVNWTNHANLTYDGTEKTVTAALSKAEIGDDDVSLNVTGNTGTDAGRYPATATLSGDAAGNYKLAGANDKGEVTHEWTISKAETPTITFPTAGPVAYAPDGALSKVGLSFTENTYGTFAWTVPDTKPTVGNTGYEVTFTPYESAENNYDLKTQTQNVALEVTPKELTVNWANTDNLTYDGTKKTVTAALNGAEIGGDNVSLIVGGEKTCTDAGTYTATATLSGTAAGNYTLKAGTGEKQWTIDQSPVTIEWTVPDAANLVYDGSPKTVTAKVEGAVNNEQLGAALENDKQTNAGTYTVKATGLTGDKAKNYKLTGETAREFTITPKEIGILWADDTHTYDGTAKSLTATATDVVPGDTVTLTLENNSLTNAGTQEVTVTGISNTNYQLPTEGLTHTLTVKQAEIKNVTVKATETLNGAGNAVLTVTGVPKGASVTVTLDGKEIPGENGKYTARLENPKTDISEKHTFSVTVTGANYNSFEETYIVTVSHKHDLKQTVAKAATCTEAGTNGYYTCSVCKKVFKDEASETETTVKAEVIGALGHKMTETKAKAATCTEAGTNGYFTCDQCHKVFKDNAGETETTVKAEVIGALGHKMTETKAKAATCTEAGTNGYFTCGQCHKVFKDKDGETETTVKAEVIGALGHKMTETKAKAATCTEAGTNGYFTCGQCHKVFKDKAGETETTVETEFLPAQGHIYNTPTWNWTKDGDKVTATAKLTCSREDKDKVVQEVVCTLENGYLTRTTTTASCTEPGIAVYTASVKMDDGNTYTCPTTYTDFSATLEHTWNDGEVTKKATCAEEGERTFTCTECGAKKTEKIEKSTEHTPGDAVEENRMESTCTEKGHYDEVIYCTVCKKELSRVEKSIDQLAEHSWSANWSHDEHGHWKQCVNCSEKHEVSDHTPTVTVRENVKDPTCTEQGSYNEVVYCTVCHIRLSSTEKTIPALGHKVEIVQGKPATCTESGLTDGAKCSVCGEVIKEQETISAKGHTEVVDKAVAATCTTAGKTEGKHCSVCGEVLVKQEVVAAKGHSYPEKGTVIRPATCTEKGVKTFTCTVEGCGHTKTEEIAALDHDFATEFTVDKEATCTEKGSQSKHCSRCDAKTEVKEIEATGHTEVVDKAVAATCTTEGKTEGKHCSVCNEVLTAQETIPVTGHTPGETGTENVTAATCVLAGSHDEVIRCTKCTAIIERKHITDQALGHTWNDGEVTTAPTCTETGVKTFTCSVCRETKTEVIPAVGHKEETIFGKAATCTDGGLTDGAKCSVCNTVLVAQTEIPALGHSYTDPDRNPEWNWTDAETEGGRPTATATFTCETCGHKETLTEKVTVEERTVPKTCTQSGVTFYTAKVEFDGKTFENVKDGVVIDHATGHVYSEENIQWTWAKVKKEPVDPETPNEPVIVADPKTAELGEDEEWVVTAVFTCVNEGCAADADGHTVTKEAQVRRTEVPAKCEKEGSITDTAVVIFNDQEFTASAEPKTIPALGHDMATRYDAEGHWQECSRCGEHTEKADHTFGEWVNDVRVCTQEGCGHSETRTVIVTPPAPGPDPDDNQGGTTIDDNRNPLAGKPLPFTDVKEENKETGVKGDWFAPAVRYMYENQAAGTGSSLMSGTSDTLFSPGVDTTRGMLVTILWRLEGCPKAELSSFSDVAAGRYYDVAVGWGCANGIVKGYSDVLFKPDQKVTREEAAAILYRYAKYKGYDISVTADLSGFTDSSSVHSWFQSEMEWANGAGIIQGKGNNVLDPKGRTKRCEMAQLLMSFCEKYHVLETKAAA